MKIKLDGKELTIEELKHRYREITGLENVDLCKYMFDVLIENGHEVGLSW